MSFIKRDGKEEYTYKMFGYLLMAVLTIAIIVGLYIITQHTQTHEAQETLDQNQQLILDNQKDILYNQKGIEVVINASKILLQEAKNHEEREEKIFGSAIANNTIELKKHSETLKQMSDHFIKFYKEYKRDHHRGSSGYYSNDLGVPATSSNNSTQ